MMQDYSAYDLRQSKLAHFFRVSPCRFDPAVPTEEADDLAVERCAPADATWFGVYYGWTNADELSLADFDTQDEALHFARFAAAGRPIYLFDPVSGERPA